MLYRAEDESVVCLHSQSSSTALSAVLARLTHLDLTHRVQRDGAYMVAHGGFCDVFTGTASLPGAQKSRTLKVAIKRLRIHLQSDLKFAKVLARELYVWSKLDHSNVLPLLGFVLEGEYPSVVSAWMENGTVSKYLKASPNADVERLIMGLAEGVDYLHNQDIIHSDLKADNVLVGNSGEPLICDFGISRMISSSLSTAGTSTGALRGTARWMAPELFDILVGDVRHTKETDVWAFGMTVYEILTGDLPYSRLRSDAQVIFAITQRELPPRALVTNNSSPFLQSAWDVCEACWLSPPDDRITMTAIVQFLHASKSSVTPSDSGQTIYGHPEAASASLSLNMSPRTNSMKGINGSLSSPLERETTNIEARAKDFAEQCLESSIDLNASDPSNTFRNNFREPDDRSLRSDQTGFTNIDLSIDDLAPLGASWTKEGRLYRKQYYEMAGKRAKSRNWLDVFVVIQGGELKVFNSHQIETVETICVLGQHWAEKAQPIETVSLTHTLAHALPPPGYSHQRPHCFALTLASGGIYFFQASTEEVVNEWVSTCNYWAARRSKESLESLPLGSRTSNDDLTSRGWKRARSFSWENVKNLLRVSGKF